MSSTLEDDYQRICAELVATRVISWMRSKSDNYEMRYYQAGRDGNHDDKSRVAIEFCSLVAAETRRQAAEVAAMRTSPLAVTPDTPPICEAGSTSEYDRDPRNALLSTLRAALGEPFMTCHAGGEDGTYVRLKYPDLAESQRAHNALYAVLRGEY